MKFLAYSVAIFGFILPWLAWAVWLALALYAMP